MKYVKISREFKIIMFSLKNSEIKFICKTHRKIENFLCNVKGTKLVTGFLENTSHSKIISFDEKKTFRKCKNNRILKTIEFSLKIYINKSENVKKKKKRKMGHSLHNT